MAAFIEGRPAGSMICSPGGWTEGAEAGTWEGEETMIGRLDKTPQGGGV
jgi:hypothetical protein